MALCGPLYEISELGSMQSSIAQAPFASVLECDDVKITYSFRVESKDTDWAFRRIA